MAGFQVEAGCPTLDTAACTDPNSDWYAFASDPTMVADPQNFLSGDPLTQGPGHWELFDADLSRAADEIGANAIRTSFEWSRFFPTDPGTDDPAELQLQADPEAVAHYHAWLDSALAHGLEPLITVDHYTLPLWIHEPVACHADPDHCPVRGWLDHDRIVDALAGYAGFLGLEFGADVRWWATLNEPLVIVAFGYLQPNAGRTNPPAVQRPDLAFDVLWNEVDAHHAMADALHAADPDAEVGIVLNLAPAVPNNPDRTEDVSAAQHFDYVFNRLFAQAALAGAFDRDIDGSAEDVHAELASKTDWVGLNYYTQATIVGLGVPIVPGYPLTDFYPVDTAQENPAGMTDMLLELGQYGLPVIVTENGTPDLEGAGERYLQPHLDAVEDALDQGVDVRGYDYWSLIDNYEWNHGMHMPFGLYEVDLVTKERRLREIGRDYADAIRSR